MKNGYIYKLTLLKDTNTYQKGEIYIGQHNGNNKYYFCGGNIPKAIIKKYGKHIFDREVICNNITSKEELNALEIYYINYYNSYRLNTGFGLNLNKGGQYISDRNIEGENNPNYNNKWSDEQKEHLSKTRKKLFNSGKLTFSKETKEKISKASSLLWKDEHKKKIMSKKVSNKTKNYTICQFDRDMNLLKEYNSQIELMELNPDYSKSCILSTCNGWKASYKGFIWRYKSIKTNKIITPDDMKRKLSRRKNNKI